MLLIHCPYCEMDRPELEFRYAGEAHVVRAQDPDSVGDQDWSQFLYLRSNPKGLHAERWRHTNGCGRFFNCIRDTITDKIAVTYKAGQPRPETTP